MRHSKMFWDFQGQPWLLSKFKAYLGDQKACLKKKRVLFDGQYRECLLSMLRVSHSEEHAWFCSPLAEKDLTFSLYILE